MVGDLEREARLVLTGRRNAESVTKFVTNAYQTFKKSDQCGKVPERQPKTASLEMSLPNGLY